MRTILALFVLFLSVESTYAQTLQQKQYNLKNNLALEGYDPMSYFDGNPVEGKSTLKFTHNGVIYQFSTQANLNKFKASPEKFEPAYGGWCAYAMGEAGEKVKVDLDTYKILDGKLYLFYNFWGNNTRTDWDKNEKKLKEAADRNWIKFVK